ncbi:hypothetical protein [Zongyangia hominis]|uniref:Uncharacterized protein n=1 Tax=Zongyangia hominis TaxID=2763677 RepID=A0A926I6Z2_9FIRM|nr:hypothetical protein [Zongyangia hominis]MBC8570554.1 hypothetical protein [Zongyangia hominis]
MVNFFYQYIAAKRDITPEDLKREISEKIAYVWEHPDEKIKRIQKKRPDLPDTDEIVWRILRDG